ncbi:ornithine cyclodeaminase family protein [Saccharothrix syringae]|nr:ornithine cyclodeaminase family protein [Saccharothrix syringae]
MRIFDEAAVRELLPMSAAIPVMREALRAFSAGQVHQPLRTMVPGADGDVLAVMPAFVSFGGGRGMFGLKAIAVKPGNPARGLDPHPGLVLVLDPDTAAPVAAVDGTSLTAIRTAAVSAVATDALARPDAGVLALLGSGTQARAHLEALALVRELREVRVWSRDPEHARAFAESAAGRRVVRAGSVAEAVDGADLVCTTTSSPTPLLEAGMVAAGAHVNAVGAVFPDHRELAGDLVARAGVFVDSRESALVEAGDLLSAVREGHFAASGIRAEIGEVLLGRHPGRGGDDEVTVFESLGLAVEDVMAARHVWERAAGLG